MNIEIYKKLDDNYSVRTVDLPTNDISVIRNINVGEMVEVALYQIKGSVATINSMKGPLREKQTALYRELDLIQG